MTVLLTYLRATHKTQMDKVMKPKVFLFASNVRFFDRADFASNRV
jgi:hypothetical protein